MKIQTKKIREIHVPNKLKFKNIIHEITNLDKKFIIKDYQIKTNDDKIDTVILYNPHPNANPQTGEFCIPYNLRDFEINEKSLNIIKILLCCFNLDDCYFTPWDELKYKK